jgi:hypothetical protein
MCLTQTGVTFLLINQVVFVMDTQCLLGEVEIEFLQVLKYGKIQVKQVII